MRRKDVLDTNLHRRPSPCRDGQAKSASFSRVPLFSLLSEVDLLTGLQAHKCAPGMVAAPHEATRTLLLALTIGNLHRFHLHFKKQFDRRADFRLRCIRSHEEDHLLVFLGDESRLFGNYRREQHFHQALFAMLDDCIHASISSIFASAGLVIRIFLEKTRETGSAWRGSQINTFGRLRDASNRFSSRLSVMTSTESRPMPLNF